MMEQEMVQTRRLSWSDLVGASLLSIGLMFVGVKYFGTDRLENWWGFFILLPGLLFLGMGWLGHGRAAILSRISSGIGLVVVTVATMFLFNFDWSLWWPLMLIMPGVGLWLVGGSSSSVGVTAVLRLGRWAGFTMLLLGLTFLADQFALISLPVMSGDFHWWGLFILIPGVGALIEALRVLGQSLWAATSLFVVAAWILSAGMMELLDPNWVSWEGMVGIGLIGSGLAVWLFNGIRPSATS